MYTVEVYQPRHLVLDFLKSLCNNRWVFLNLKKIKWNPRLHQQRSISSLIISHIISHWLRCTGETSVRLNTQLSKETSAFLRRSAVIKVCIQMIQLYQGAHTYSGIWFCRKWGILLLISAFNQYNSAGPIIMAKNKLIFHSVIQPILMSSESFRKHFHNRLHVKQHGASLEQCSWLELGDIVPL